MSDKNTNIYEFGSFRLDAETDTLWQDDQLISISPKGFELLKLLVMKQGGIVSKEEIFETVWKDTFVEDGVLTQNIYTLRNALGKDENENHLIENIARRGYRISVPVLLINKEKLKEIDEPKKELEDDLEQTEAMILEHSPQTSSSLFIFRERKYLFGIVFVAALLSVLAFVLYNSSEIEEKETQNKTLENLEFQRLTDKGDVNFLNISPDGNWLAYSNTKGIFLKDIKANSEVALKIENFEDFGSLQFSNDATSLYFRSPEASYISGNVYQTSRFGGVAKMVAENVWSGFSFSPDGKKIAFTRVNPAGNKHILVVKDLKTGTETELTTRIPPLEFYPRNFPAWSADGKKIASIVVTRTEHFAELIVTDVETAKEEKIEIQGFQNLEQLVWSSDGNSIIASASDGKNFQLWRITYPGGETSRITNDLNDYLGISITSDGKTLLSRQRKYFSNIWISNGSDLDSFQQLTEGSARNEGLKGMNWIGDEKIVYTANYEKLRDWNLWAINTTDNSRQQLTSETNIQNEYPVISPDKNWIFYSSNQGEAANIWQISVNGGTPNQMTFDEKESEYFPQVSPNGDWLYYIKEGENSSAVWRKSLLDNKNEKITQESQLSPTNFLSLSPDGKYLAFQNLTKEKDNNKSSGLFKVCVISTENINEKRFYEIDSSQPIAYFSRDGKFLDYIKNTAEDSNIWRLNLYNDAEPTSILNLKNEWIFKMAWSENGEKLAIARGNLIRDAVVLTGFE